MACVFCSGKCGHGSWGHVYKDAEANYHYANVCKLCLWSAWRNYSKLEPCPETWDEMYDRCKSFSSDVLEEVAAKWQVPSSTITYRHGAGAIKSSDADMEMDADMYSCDADMDIEYLTPN